MKQVKIIRLETPYKDTSDQTSGTIGALYIDGVFKCFTLEPPWRSNGPDSCIITGTYLCKRIKSLKFGITFEITGVEGHTNIEIHWGNEDKDTTGCVLLGRILSAQGLFRSVGESRSAFSEFLSVMGGEQEFNLTIEAVV